MQAITDALLSAGPAAVPVVATEVPTGCGKTMALLSSVLRYQAAVKGMPRAEARAHLRQRAYGGFRQAERHQQQQRRRGGGGTGKATKPCKTAPGTATGGNGAGDGDDAGDEEDGEWSAPPEFFRQFRIDRAKRLRVEVDPTGSPELRRRFAPPPCTIFYATRTHAQLSQAVRELRRLVSGGGDEREGRKPLPGLPGGGAEAPQLRMNILSSRERYCVNPTVRRAADSRAPPVEGNGLGEVCDKLVSLGQCDCAHDYDELACSAIDGATATGSQKLHSCCGGGGGSGSGSRSAGNIWDLEDLVMEGVARQSCPYYAARALVFYADINFCTYNYLLDPLIRLECRFESAIENNTIVVLDEAHNVASVCQDALSLSVPFHVLAGILAELGPLVGSSASSSTAGAGGERGGEGRGGGDNDASHRHQHQQQGPVILSYQRSFQLSHYSLGEVFAFLFTLFRAIDEFYKPLTPISADGSDDAPPPASSGNSGRTKCNSNSNSGGSGGESVSGEQLVKAVARRLTEFMTHNNLHTRHETATEGDSGNDLKRTAPPLPPPPAPRSAGRDKHCWLPMLKCGYALIMSLGVTFNPFQLSIFTLSMVKRWLLIVRFLVLKPTAFAVAVVPHRGRWTSPGGDGAPETARRGGADTTTASNNASANHCDVRCLDGSLAFHHLLQSTHRVVLASGTLAPFAQLGTDLGLTPARATTAGGGPTATATSRTVRLSPLAPAPLRTFDGLHVVGPDQYILRSLTALPPFNGTALAPLFGDGGGGGRGGGGCGVAGSFRYGSGAQGGVRSGRGAGTAPSSPLHCTFGNLGSDAFLGDLAHAICRLSTTVPAGGVLIFAPNYRVMELLHAKTKALVVAAAAANGRGSSSGHRYEVLAEPRKALELTAVLDHFKSITTTTTATCPTGTGGGGLGGLLQPRRRPARTTALLFSVYRGKISEGIDFTDDMARLVMCVGVPMLPLRSWTVKAQRSFSGPEWYVTDAVRAVNQALGRCLRHIHDFGAVVLLDDRYGEANNDDSSTNGGAGNGLQQRLSRWCRDSLVAEDSLAALADELVSFFSQHNLTGGGGGASEASSDAKLFSSSLPLEECSVNHTEGKGSSPGAKLGTARLPFTRIARPGDMAVGCVGSGSGGGDDDDGTTATTTGHAAKRSPSPVPASPADKGSRAAPPPGQAATTAAVTTTTTIPPTTTTMAAVPPHRHPWAATALKLLYEEDQGGALTAARLRQRLTELEAMFAQ